MIWSKSSTVLFVQLPLVDHGYNYIYGNIEYAPASLAGYVNTLTGHRVRAHVLPRHLSLFASDRVIADYIADIEPDLVCFTLYCWNAERSRSLAARLKNRLPRCTILCGGPEVAPGSSMLAEHEPAVDCFVQGEGEWFFQQVISENDLSPYRVMVNNNTTVIQPPHELIPLHQTFEPLTGSMLSPMPDGSSCIEITRGCPYKCSYCYYSKNCPGIRERDFETLEKALTTKGLTELYLLSPTFDRSSGFHDRLRLLAAANPGITLHTEMRAGAVDAQTAGLLYKAGFRSLEVGLQTMTRKALKKASRASDPERELNGMKILHDAGIDLKIGIIPGLPGDTPEEFIRSIDLLADHGLAGSIELYPLMVLPGTAIRETALQEGARFLTRPPYYFQCGWGFDARDIRSIIDYTEERTGFSHLPRSLPDCTQNTRGQLTRGIHMSDKDSAAWHASHWSGHVETNVFTFFIQLTDPKKLYRGIPHLLDCINRQELFNIIITGNALLDEEKITAAITGREGDTFYRRLHFFDQWETGLSVRFYQFFNDYSAFSRAAQTYVIVEPAARLDTTMLDACEQLGTQDCGVLVPRGTYGAAKNFLVKNYAHDAPMVAFEQEEELKRFYNDIGLEYSELSFSLRVQ